MLELQVREVKRSSLKDGRDVPSQRKSRGAASDGRVLKAVGGEGKGLLRIQKPESRNQTAELPNRTLPPRSAGHAESLAIGYRFTEAEPVLTSACATPYPASAKLPSATPPVALSVAVPVAVPVVQTVALSFASPVAQTIAVRIALPVAVPAAGRTALPVALPAILPVALPVAV